jgi:aldose 1-epimerase
MGVLPSGTQIDISHGRQRATVVEVGGGLRSYRIADRDVLDGCAAEMMCTGGRGQVLMPWPNRIRDGRYEFSGQTQQLPLSESAVHNAIHGLVRWVAWELMEQASQRVVMGYVLHPSPGYPFSLELSIEYALSDDGLQVRTTARNIGSQRCPFGTGMHPYLTVGVVPVDDVVLEVPGRVHLRADERGIPVAREPVTGTELDLRLPRPIGGARLDDCFSDLERDTDGRAWVHLGAPDGPRGLSLWVDEAYDYLMLFTGDTLSSGAREAVAVEPMSCAPDAFNSGDGLLILEPGDTFSGAWGITPRAVG